MVLRKKRLFIWLGILSVVVVLMIVYLQVNSKESRPSFEAEMAVIDEVKSIISSNTIYEVTEETLVEGALRGMAHVIKDPYSTYYSVEEAVVNKQALAGDRIGIGLEITESNGHFIVVSPIKKSPAEAAGILAFDELVQIDKVRIDGMRMDEVLKLISGKEGQAISIVVYRPTEELHLTFTMKREKLNNETVRSEVYEELDEKIGYIEISIFGENTAEQWLLALETMKAKEITGLVIDVRDNPGGYLRTASQLLSTFREKSTTFGFMENASGELEVLDTVQLDMQKEDLSFLSKVPIVILQNRGSASASEVFAAALKDWQMATIIGETSFGKGTVQETWPLSNGGELKLSTHKWLTMKKEWIHGKGILPNIEQAAHPLRNIQIEAVSGNFVAGDFATAIAYSQRVLKALGYSIVREDGYFDEVTEEAVETFRHKYDLVDGKNIDESFFRMLTQEMQKVKTQAKSDTQLQMAVSYIIHELDTQ